MNDFTKEELIKIKQYVGFCDYHTPISSKIQSMIDNYCEHEKVVPNYGPNTECATCGEIW